MLFLLSIVVGESTAFASTLKDLQQEQKQVEQKKKDLDSNITQKQSELQTNKTSIDDVMAQIKQLNGQIEETNENINKVTANIAKTTEEIEALQASIAELERKIAERDEVLRERMRAMQIKGGKVNYLDVLLGANSFADFIDRFSAVNNLMDADRKIMTQQQEDIDKLEEEKKLVEQKLKEQQEQKDKLDNLKKSLDGQKQQKNQLIDKLEAEQERLSQEKKELEEEFHDVYEVSKELEGKIQAEQNRLAEIARQAELERKRKAQAASSSGGGGGSSSALPSVSAGNWTKPANGRFSSGFGYRIHPISGVRKQHRGVDIANSVGTPIVAAADGVVSFAGYMSGFGNVIMITHSIEGNIFTTVYAHLSSIGTSSGQHVSKGQYIAGMGNTGASTGSHLHFEVHVGNFTGYGPSAVNPLRYVSF